MNRCETCQLIKTRDSGEAPLWNNIFRTDHFDVVHAFNSYLPGWIVLVARRHISAIDEMTTVEAGESGILIRQISLQLKSILGCSKTYLMQFAEQSGHSHVHFHIVPRMENIPDENKGVNIFNYLGASEKDRVSEPRMNEIAKIMQQGLGKKG